MNIPFRIFFFAIVFSLFLCACSSSLNSNSNVNSVTNSPAKSPTPNKEEETAKFELDQKSKEEAINSFFAKQFKGWVVEGRSEESLTNCEEGSTCEILLSKGTQRKVVSFIVRKFYKADGTSFWFVYEPTRIEIASLRLSATEEAIKEEAKKETIENLTFDDCEGVIDEVRQDAN